MGKSKKAVERRVEPLVRRCPFCGEQPWHGQYGYSCSNQRCAAFELRASLEDWNKRNRPIHDSIVSALLLGAALGIAFAAACI